MDTFEDGMPKVDDEGRKIVRIVAEELSSGWRYGHEDTLILGYVDFDAEVAIPWPNPEPELEPKPVKKDK